MLGQWIGTASRILIYTFSCSTSRRRPEWESLAAVAGLGLVAAEPEQVMKGRLTRYSFTLNSIVSTTLTN